MKYIAGLFPSLIFAFSWFKVVEQNFNLLITLNIILTILYYHRLIVNKRWAVMDVILLSLGFGVLAADLELQSISGAILLGTGAVLWYLKSKAQPSTEE